MSSFMMILTIGAVVISIFSLVYTYYAAKQQRVIRGEIDTKIDEDVQDHPYLRNPVFLAYIIFGVLVLLFIFYFTFQFYR
ncbi:hypothetical protein SAMN05877753_10823 [Bacillus oleivorans]|uniref:Uncharacterized protein n=1 Tax=Bacillus oleivorans TaxID=1448271 RepID=A0A285D2A0_9BACI|nr:hypothetical protein [Bacillus oleivorans]SNX73902.1 hypothetical protein SAMN05877753_10823 [Bacillus oleivorans]